MKDKVTSGKWRVANSATLALRAPKGLEFGFERRPISAVFCLLGARLGIQRFAQCLALARRIQAEQWAAPV